MYKLLYAANSTCAINVLPINVPNISPKTVADNEYKMYLIIIVDFLYPNDFNVPIFILSSSTILVIVVTVTKAATIKNITGNTFPMIPIFSKSLSKDLNALLSYNFIV